MNRPRSQSSNTHLYRLLEHYVACVQQQMQQLDRVSASPGQTAEQQIKLEQTISRQLVRSFL